MRQVTNGTITLDVVGHAMTKNAWEFYITEAPNDEGIGYALVCGDAVEIGSFDWNEIEPHLWTYTTKLEELMPPIGWQWSDYQAA